MLVSSDNTGGLAFFCEISILSYKVYEVTKLAFSLSLLLNIMSDLLFVLLLLCDCPGDYVIVVQ